MQKKGKRAGSLRHHVPIEEVESEEDNSPLLKHGSGSNSPINIVEDLGTGRIHARLSSVDNDSTEIKQLIANASAENIVLPNIVPQMGSPSQENLSPDKVSRNDAAQLANTTPQKHM